MHAQPIAPPRFVAFQGNPSVKHQRIFETKRRVTWNQSGERWDSVRGCPSGHELDADAIAYYQDEFGIPGWLAQLQNMLFEGINDAKALSWHVQFLDAAPIGADLETIKVPFMLFALERATKRYRHAAFPDITEYVNRVIGCLKRGASPLHASVSAHLEAEKVLKAARQSEAAVLSGACAAIEAASWVECSYCQDSEQHECVCRMAEFVCLGEDPGDEDHMVIYDEMADKLLQLMREAG